MSSPVPHRRAARLFGFLIPVAVFLLASANAMSSGQEKPSGEHFKEQLFSAVEKMGGWGNALKDLKDVPEGFSKGEYKKLLSSVVQEGSHVVVGGVDMIVARMDRPLVFKGYAKPAVAFVPLSKEQLEEGILPGDEAPGSGPGTRSLYFLDESQDGSGDEDPVIIPPALPSAWGQIWNDKNGSGLLVGTDSYIEMETSASPVCALRWFNRCLVYMTTRTGTARFRNPKTGVSGDVPVTLFSLINPDSPVLTTYFARTEFIVVAGFFVIPIWVVYNPEVWIDVGEDGWDEITLKGDVGSRTNPIELKRVKVVHNGRAIMDKNLPTVPENTLVHLERERALKNEIWEYKWAKVMNSTHPTVMTAVNDYAKGPQADYPVFLNTNPDSSGYGYPHSWCTEFTTWAFGQTNPLLLTNECMPSPRGCILPSLQTLYNDQFYGDATGIGHIIEWGRVTYNNEYPYPYDLRLLEFNDDKGNNNGPTPDEWESLAYPTVWNNNDPNGFVHAGDYVAWLEYELTLEMVNNFPVFRWVVDRGHSMVVAGWLSDNKKTIDPSYFDINRDCNLLRVVSGNNSNQTRVHDVVVCRPDHNAQGDPIDPQCMIDTNGDGVPEHLPCGLRLWDPNEHNTGLPDADYDEGAYFAIMR